MTFRFQAFKKKKNKNWEISDGFILYLGTKVSSSKSWYSLVRPTIKIKCMWRCTAKAVKSFKILTTFSSLFLKFHIKGKKKKTNNWEILRQCYLLSEKQLRNSEAMLFIEWKHFFCTYSRKYSHGSKKATIYTKQCKLCLIN